MLCGGSSLEMIGETIDRGICISLNKDLVLSGKPGKGTPDESGEELEEYLQAKHPALSADINTVFCYY